MAVSCWSLAFPAVSSGAVARRLRCALPLLLGTLAVAGFVLASSVSGGSALGSCSHSMVMVAPVSAGTSALAGPQAGDLAGDGSQRVNLEPMGSADGRGCPQPMGLLGVCLGFLAILVMIWQVRRLALAVVRPVSPGPDPVRAQPARWPAPALAQLCVLRI